MPEQPPTPNWLKLSYAVTDMVSTVMRSGWPWAVCLFGWLSIREVAGKVTITSIGASIAANLSDWKSSALFAGFFIVGSMYLRERRGRLAALKQLEPLIASNRELMTESRQLPLPVNTGNREVSK